MAKQKRAKRKRALNPDNQKLLDIKYTAQNELETAMDWGLIWKTADCELFCERISESEYQLSFYAGKGQYSFDTNLIVPKDKIEFLMGAIFAIGERRELYNNFKPTPGTKGKLSKTKKLEKERNLILPLKKELILNG